MMSPLLVGHVHKLMMSRHYTCPAGSILDMHLNIPEHRFVSFA